MTTKQYGHIRKLGELYRLLCDKDVDIHRARQIVHGAMVESLPTRYAISYHSFEKTATARQLADNEDMAIQQASTILADLCEWGLLARYDVTTANGVHYEYFRVKVE